jgi:hypothetical protein
MRVCVLFFAMLLCAGPAAAQGADPLDLPVSLERIREALAAPRTPSLLEALEKQPHFRVEVQERRPTFAEMFSLDDFYGGPVPPGGLYAYEQARRLSPNSTPALVSLDLLPMFRGIASAVGDARRNRAAAAARAEVQRAMAEFCASRPNGGEGIAGCAQ